MGKIRNQALEDAAKLVETFPERLLHFWERPGGPPGNGFRPTTRSDIAAAVRALKETKQVGGGHRIGGLARMALMTPEERSAFARAGALAMHAKKRACNRETGSA